MSTPRERQAAAKADLLRSDPFTTEEGQNPFGERPPSGDDVDHHVPLAYETTEQSRGGLLLTLACVGWAPPAYTWLAWAMDFWVGDGSHQIAAIVLTVASLAPLIAAGTLGISDLRAMQLGAMEDSSRASTWWAVALGWLGALAVVALFAAMYAAYLMQVGDA